MHERELTPFERHLGPNQKVYQQGEISKEMYYIRKGRMKIITLKCGREKVLSILEEGDFFGEMALIDGSPRIYTAVAMEETELLIIDKTSFEAMLSTHPVIAHIIKTVIQRLKDITSMISSKDAIKV